MVDEISARGEVVLAELKLLVSLAAEPSNPHSETSIQQNGAAPARNHPTIMIKTPQQPPPKAAPVAFPRRRTQSITKLNKSPPSSKPKTDENVHPGKANLDIGRVKRKLSGGLSNILRPWPLVTKTQTQTPPERQPPSTSVDSEEKGGLRKIKRKVSSNLRAMRATASEEKPRPVKASSQQRSRAVSTGNRTLARESVCSRNSTVSVLEYLAARRLMEDEQRLYDDRQYLVPLSEYGRNCHLYGCDTPHIRNPDKNSSRTVIHCDCDRDNLSKSHAHLDMVHPLPRRRVLVEDPEMISASEENLFYRPGNSTSTCVIDVSKNPSSASGRPPA